MSGSVNAQAVLDVLALLVQKYKYLRVQKYKYCHCYERGDLRSSVHAQAVARGSPTPGTSPLAADEGGRFGGGTRLGGGGDGSFSSSSFGPLPASSFPSLPSFPKEKSVSGASIVKNPWGRNEGSPRPGSLRPHAR
jgi:hypothetical protein